MTTTIKNITHTNYTEKFYQPTTSSATLIVQVRRVMGDANPIIWQVAYDDPTLPDTDWYSLTVDAVDFPIPTILPDTNISGVSGFRIIPTNDVPAYAMQIQEIIPGPVTI